MASRSALVSGANFLFNIRGDHTQGNQSGNKYLMVSLSIFEFSNLASVYTDLFKEIGGNYTCSVNNKTFSVLQHGFNKAHLS